MRVCTGRATAKLRTPTGLIVPAIDTYGLSKGTNTVATTTGPLANMTWGQIAQANSNLWASAQTSTGGTLNGGWRYAPGDEDSDTSTTQWAVISLIYNKVLAATTPGFLKTDLKGWLGRIQNAAGAGCYQPDLSFACDHSDTGSFLLASKFVDTDVNESHVQAALSYLNTNWKVTLPKRFRCTLERSLRPSVRDVGRIQGSRNDDRAEQRHPHFEFYDELRRIWTHARGRRLHLVRGLLAVVGYEPECRRKLDRLFARTRRLLAGSAFDRIPS